jgi:hypothetical protein
MAALWCNECCTAAMACNASTRLATGQPPDRVGHPECVMNAAHRAGTEVSGVATLAVQHSQTERILAACRLQPLLALATARTATVAEASSQPPDEHRADLTE